MPAVSSWHLLRAVIIRRSHKVLRSLPESKSECFHMGWWHIHILSVGRRPSRRRGMSLPDRRDPSLARGSPPDDPRAVRVDLQLRDAELMLTRRGLASLYPP